MRVPACSPGITTASSSFPLPGPMCSTQGYCSLGVLCQNLENHHLRSALGMAPNMSGVLVNTIQKTSNAAKARGSRGCGRRGRPERGG